MAKDLNGTVVADDPSGGSAQETAAFFTIFVSARNCAPFVEPCLQSLRVQTCQDFRILFVDDASEDDTASCAETFLRAHFAGRHRIVRNAERLGKCANAFLNIPDTPSECVAILDGDDHLVNDDILAVFKASYGYGYDAVWSNYRCSDGRQGHCGPLNPLAQPRRQGWRTSHFFSFRQELFCNVPEAYFLDEAGNWLMSACDQAIALPVLDQTRRYHFVPEMAYFYRTDNPDSHHNAKPGGTVNALSSDEQRRNSAQVFSKPPLPCTRPIEGAEVPFRRLMHATLTQGFQKIDARMTGIGLETAAIMHLKSEEKIPLPWLSDAGGWSMEARAYEYICHLLDAVEIPRVLEFGSGAGSKILHRLVANRGGTCLSVEHDAHFYRTTQDELAAAGLAHETSVVHAPLLPAKVFGIDTQFYDMSRLPADQRFNLVLIDGPPSATSPLARLAALPAVSPLVEPGNSRVILDDYERPAERKTVEIWKQAVPELHCESITFAKHICVMHL